MAALRARVVVAVVVGVLPATTTRRGTTRLGAGTPRVKAVAKAAARAAAKVAAVSVAAAVAAEAAMAAGGTRATELLPQCLV